MTALTTTNCTDIRKSLFRVIHTTRAAQKLNPPKQNKSPIIPGNIARAVIADAIASHNNPAATIILPDSAIDAPDSTTAAPLIMVLAGTGNTLAIVAVEE